MRATPPTRRVYRAINRPLLLCGVDRRLFLLALLVGVAVFNVLQGFLAGCLLFGVLYGAARWGDRQGRPDAADCPRLDAGARAVRRRPTRPGRDRHPRPAVITMGRLLEDSREAGALNQLIALWGFVDETTFLTKAGAVGVVYRLHGADAACLDPIERHVVARRFEQALRQLDASFRVYQYLVKRPAAPITATPHRHPVVDEALRRRAASLAARAESLFEFDLSLVVLYEGWTPRQGTWARLADLWRAPPRHGAPAPVGPSCDRRLGGPAPPGHGPPGTEGRGHGDPPGGHAAPGAAAQTRSLPRAAPVAHLHALQGGGGDAALRHPSGLYAE